MLRAVVTLRHRTLHYDMAKVAVIVNDELSYFHAEKVLWVYTTWSLATVSGILNGATLPTSALAHNDPQLATWADYLQDAVARYVDSIKSLQGEQP